MDSIERITQQLNQRIKTFTPLAGGDINRVYLVETESDYHVVKINSADRFPNMLAKEKKGLMLLKSAGVAIPQPLDCFSDEEMQYLLLAYIKEEPVTPKFWESLALNLVKLHQNTSHHFGLGYDNYIGSLKQDNTQTEDWTTFFITKRLNPLVKRAFEHNLLSEKELKQFDHLHKKLDHILPREVPSLLHGDLWRGNIMCGLEQTPVFIDPAIYYGHREMDLAMTQLFGGFNPLYISVYNEAYPLEVDWQRRIEINNLYPNLVHLNLFGRGYFNSIKTVLNQFT